MKLTHVSVRNYKGLFNTETPLKDFVCAIGENNAGKSTLLQALLLFINGSKLSSADYYDPEEDILITVLLDGVTDETLGNLLEEHRTKISPYVDDNKLVLARRYSTDGSSKLRVVTQIPKELKFRDENVNLNFKGKKGKEIEQTLLATYPEVADGETASAAKTQKVAKELIQAYVDTLESDALEEADVPLPTGIDNSIRSLLPEPVYIPAVKDLADDLKTKESASFGKLLQILLNVIEEDLTEARETFENLRKKLNRITGDDGLTVDDRMEKVVEIEKTIQDNLSETFRNVEIELQIPPPEIKAVLSGANIVADDGVKGPIDNKGDGFKRAITFSILRSYVQLSQNPEWKKEDEQDKPTKEKFLFLFEEPELYLHPRAQNILFDALSLISKRHQVIVTTHSPLFFSANETTTFLKIIKKEDRGHEKPYGECLPVDLTDVDERDKFQLISFETSNMAFFSKKIVLAEGDSELIVLPHIAKLLNDRWDFKTTSTSLVKINGKGSFKRYSEFFQRFEAKIALLADLDILLDDFDKINPSDRAVELRNDLLRDVDTHIDEQNLLQPVPPKMLKREIQQERTRALHEELIAARQAGDTDKATDVLDRLFSFERTNPRLEVLKAPPNQAIIDKKYQLLTELRSQNVFVLQKGAIEAYYPEAITGRNKIAKAQEYCTTVTSDEQVCALCSPVDCDGETVPELKLIMQCVFNN